MRSFYISLLSFAFSSSLAVGTIHAGGTLTAARPGLSVSLPFDPVSPDTLSGMQGLLRTDAGKKLLGKIPEMGMLNRLSPDSEFDRGLLGALALPDNFEARIQGALDSKDPSKQAAVLDIIKQKRASAVPQILDVALGNVAHIMRVTMYNREEVGVRDLVSTSNELSKLTFFGQDVRSEIEPVTRMARAAKRSGLILRAQGIAEEILGRNRLDDLDQFTKIFPLREVPRIRFAQSSLKSAIVPKPDEGLFIHDERIPGDSPYAKKSKLPGLKSASLKEYPLETIPSGVEIRPLKPGTSKSFRLSTNFFPTVMFDGFSYMNGLPDEDESALDDEAPPHRGDYHRVERGPIRHIYDPAQFQAVTSKLPLLSKAAASAIILATTMMTLITSGMRLLSMGPASVLLPAMSAGAILTSIFLRYYYKHYTRNRPSLVRTLELFAVASLLFLLPFRAILVLGLAAMIAPDVLYVLQGIVYMIREGLERNRGS